MTLTVRILGCGSSGGVPRVANGWGDCDPAEPRNRRRRCSILLRRKGDAGVTTVLVDTSPDLRDQMLDAGVSHLDAVLYTHDHADHTHGIDDLRPLVIRNKRRIPVFADIATSETLNRRFGYAFVAPPASDYPPILTEHRLRPLRPVSVDGAGGPIEALPFEVWHGRPRALGFRFGRTAYTPDISAIPEESLPSLEGLDLWIIDALRRRPHPTHFSLDDALGWIERLKPRRAVLTNMHTDLDYRTLAAALPAGVVPAHDGMELELV